MIRIVESESIKYLMMQHAAKMLYGRLMQRATPDINIPDL